MSFRGTLFFHPPFPIHFPQLTEPQAAGTATCALGPLKPRGIVGPSAILQQLHVDSGHLRSWHSRDPCAGQGPRRRVRHLEARGPSMLYCRVQSATSQDTMLTSPGARFQIGLSGEPGPSSSSTASPIRSWRITRVGVTTSPATGTPRTSSQNRVLASRSGVTAAKWSSRFSPTEWPNKPARWAVA